jgi:hypothetical protein
MCGLSLHGAPLSRVLLDGAAPSSSLPTTTVGALHTSEILSATFVRTLLLHTRLDMRGSRPSFLEPACEDEEDAMDLAFLVFGIS